MICICPLGGAFWEWHVKPDGVRLFWCYACMAGPPPWCKDGDRYPVLPPVRYAPA